MKIFPKLLLSFASIVVFLSGAACASQEVESYSISASTPFQKLQEAKSNLIWSGRPVVNVNASNHPFVKEYGFSKVDKATCQSYVDCLLSVAGADGLSDQEEKSLFILVQRSRINELLTPAEEFQPVMENLQSAIQKAKSGGYKGADVTEFAKIHSRNLKVLLGEDVKNIEKATAIAMLCDALVIAGADGLSVEEVGSAREIANTLDVSKEFELIKKYSILATQLANIEYEIESFYTEVLINK